MPEQARNTETRARKAGNYGVLLTTALKRLFRARGLKYRDVALAVGVAEATIKRWMSARGLTVDQLELLCGAVGLGVAELTELAIVDYDDRASKISEEQEESLARDPLLAMVFALILRGWSAVEIKRECAIDEATLVAHLARLDKIKLIELMPGNLLRLLTRRELQWSKDSPVRLLFQRHTWQHFVKMDLRAPDAIWVGDTLRLSERSIAQLEQIVAEYSRKLRELAETDRAPDVPAKHWYIAFAAVRPVEWVFPLNSSQDVSSVSTVN